MRKLAPFLAAVCLVGCHHEEPPMEGSKAPPTQPLANASKGQPSKAAAAQPNYGGGGGGGVAPIGSGMAGGISPVSGSDSVGGGGMGGLGQAAKDQARNAAGKAAGGDYGEQ